MVGAAGQAGRIEAPQGDPDPKGAKPDRSMSHPVDRRQPKETM
jgi:hypothetical protein